jgi:hypothetical protein
MTSEFQAAFDALRDILRRHAGGMIVQTDTPTDLIVATRALAPNGKPMWFGCVSVKKTAVTFHLMPLYFNPKLQGTVPAELLVRQQGKTCFNFKRPDTTLFELIDDLTRRGRAAWEQQGMLSAGPVTPEQLDSALRAGGEEPAAIARHRKYKGAAAATKRAETIRTKSSRNR